MTLEELRKVCEASRRNHLAIMATITGADWGKPHPALREAYLTTLRAHLAWAEVAGWTVAARADAAWLIRWVGAMPATARALNWVTATDAEAIASGKLPTL